MRVAPSETTIFNIFFHKSSLAAPQKAVRYFKKRFVAVNDRFYKKRTSLVPAHIKLTMHNAQCTYIIYMYIHMHNSNHA